MAATNFVEGMDTFGIEDNTYSTSESIYDMIESGGSPVASAKDVEPIKEEKPKEELPKEPKEAPKEEPTFDFDPLGEEEPTPQEPQSSSEEPSPENNEPEPEDDTSIYASYAQDFQELGIFSELLEGQEEPDITTPEGLKQRLDMEVANRANNFLWNNILSTHGEEGQRMFEAIFVNKVPVEQYLQAYNKVESVKNLTLEDNETNQEKVLRAYYNSKNRKPEWIENKITKLKDIGELESEAIEAHEEMIQFEESTLQQMEEQAAMREAQAQQEQALYRQNITNIFNEKLKTKDFGGIPFTPKAAQEAYAELTQPRWKLPDGTPLTDFDKWVLDLRDPKNHEEKAWFWMMKKQREKDPTLAAIKKKGVAEEIKNNPIFKNAQRQKNINNQNKTGLNSTKFVDL